MALCFVLRPINPGPYVLPVSTFYLLFSCVFLGGLIREKLGVKPIVNISQLFVVVLCTIFLLGVTVFIEYQLKVTIDIMVGSTIGVLFVGGIAFLCFVLKNTKRH
jgi:uncharacterized membrane protein YjjP (DUF1212 family)